MKFYSHEYLVLSTALILLLSSSHGRALPAIVSRATDSIAALLTSGKQAAGNANQAMALQQHQQQQQQQQQLNSTAAGASLQQQQSSLQAHLSSLQNQAQRQMSQLNGLMLSGAQQLISDSPLAANSTNLAGAQAAPIGSAAGSNKIGNVLEVLSNVGKAIQQQIMGNNNGANVQIMTAPSSSMQPIEAANVKKNEYQSIVVGENQSFNNINNNNVQQIPSLNINSTNYREQGEVLRQEIVRRAGQLQQVVASSMDVLKNNGDLIVRRLLEQLNHRLDQAKSKADKIINEPATNEMGVRALNTINQGLNNLNNIITNIVNRLDLSSKEAIQQQINGQVQRQAGSVSLLDSNRIRQNLQQLGQQFSSAINAVQQQRQMQQQQQFQATRI